ncbi:acyl-CoA dehydrogenase [Escherichia coli]|nr:protein ves [Escherichia coli STEC_94C]OTB45890.1 protein ves [Escherichia coli]GDN38019.1 cold-shock protein [Escherichia coli]STH66028.1 acyl-CoA dehydrogenase [Escherichia coli]
MEYFDMRKMSVNLWRNAAGETREICTFPPAKRDFTGVPALHPSRRMGSFLCFPAWKG